MPASSELPRVFVSYARADALAFARELRAKWEAAGLTLWQNLPSMAPWQDWWQQITAAIDGAYLQRSARCAAVREIWRAATDEGGARCTERDPLPAADRLPMPHRTLHPAD